MTEVCSMFAESSAAYTESRTYKNRNWLKRHKIRKKWRTKRIDNGRKW